MESEIKSEKKTNPVENANFLSVFLFLYMFPIFKQTFQKDITEDTLYKPLHEHKSNILGEKLDKLWKQEYIKHQKWTLHISLFKLIGLQYVFVGLINILDQIILVVIMPYAIGELVSFFEKCDVTATYNDAYIYSGVVVACLVTDSLLFHPSTMGILHMSMKLRVACSALMYRKILKLSKSSLENTTIGQIVNLLSNDVSKLETGLVLSQYIFLAPIQTIIGTYLLYREIGYCAFFGVAFIICFIPLQVWFGKLTAELRLNTALKTDERVRIMDEIISGIQVIKMYCWEIPFNKLVSDARRNEINVIRKRSYLMGFVYSLEMFVTRTSIFISIVGYVLLGNYVTAQKVFIVTAIYNILRPVITTFFSMSLSSFAEIHVSVTRLQKFLSNEELPDEKVLENVNAEKCKIYLNKISAKWTEENLENVIKNVNLNITNPSQLIAIIGPVGSGKSTLLNVILKELVVTSGDLDIVGKISYSNQQPWLFSSTIRHNIVFNNKYDEERYRKVVQICALESDFALFPYGDKTLVGEKGKSLSGGQKARINLARCVYKEADIYLLDDPLSAVDSNVGKHLYENCICQFLSKKICVLVTHQLQYLNNCDKIVIMKDGSIQQEGSFDELVNEGIDFGKLLRKVHFQDELDDKQSNSLKENDDTAKSFGEDDGPNVEKEFMGSGSIGIKIYYNYFKAGGNIVMIIMLILTFGFGQVFATAGDYFVSYWVKLEQDFTRQKEENSTNDFDQIEPFTRQEIIYFYSTITVGTILFAIGYSLYFMLFFTKASMNLHKQIFSKIINATMSFFNNNPSGRILNRFSKDLGTVDEYIPSIMYDVIQIVLLLISVMVLSCLIQVWLIIPAICLMIISYFIRAVYIKTSRNLKRLEGITRSPIYSHMSASVNGLSTIRAFAAQKNLINEFDNFQDIHSSAWFLFIASSRCFSFWFDNICIVFIAVAIFSIVLFSNNIYGGDIGLIITQYIGLIHSLQWGVRQWSELENQMTSVERILEYQNVESELTIKNKEDEIPSNGEILFENVCLRYSPKQPYVLKNLNFKINHGEKIGIVGRTGAGKSSIIAALFRLYPVEGLIFIGKCNTHNISLNTIRTKISIIPQEPVLFSGSMRKNLDPFNEYPDELLWEALEQVELKSLISDLPNSLESNVTEGGANYSVGQRQLVCLARALIRKNKIIILDEATANVDPSTDMLIQSTIRYKFKDCTVLTIAHRLHTVMDSDKILVINAGSAEEFDHPYTLLQKNHGNFKELVLATGKNTAKHLEALAKDSYQNLMDNSEITTKEFK